MKKNLVIILVAFAFAGAPGTQSHAAVLIGPSGYTQTFDSLPNTPNNNLNGGTWTDNSTIADWYATATTFNTTMSVIDGTTSVSGVSGAQKVGSFGQSASTDRAFGFHKRNGPDGLVGVQLQNNFGDTLQTLTIGYKGEEWRWNATSGDNAPIIAQYSLDATSLTTGTWNSLNSLNFTLPQQPGTATAYDGNAAGNFALLSQTVTGLSVANAGTLWVRWTFQAVDYNNANYFGIDDVTITATAVPEPSTWALLAGSLTALVIFRRRR